MAPSIFSLLTLASSVSAGAPYGNHLCQVHGFRRYEWDEERVPEGL